MFALVGGIGGALMGIINEVLITTTAHKFVTGGAQTYPQANHLTSGTAFQIVPLLGLVCALLLALSLVLTSLAAMRVGLLTRMMGYIGIFAGALVLFQITQIPIVQAYWLFALAYLFSGRWPTRCAPGVAQRPGREVAVGAGDARAEGPRRGSPRRRPWGPGAADCRSAGRSRHAGQRGLAVPGRQSSQAQAQAP